MFNPRQKHESNVANAEGFLAGLVVGGLAGAGTALLLAPQSGKDTRADIQQKSIELRDRTVDTVESTMSDARSKAREITASARKDVEELQERGQDMVEKQQDRLSADADWASPK